MDRSTLNTEATIAAAPKNKIPPKQRTPVEYLDLVVQRIRLRAWRRVAWLRHLWKQSGGGADRNINYHQAIDAILAGADNHAAEQAWMAQEESLVAWNKDLILVEQILEKATDAPINVLGRQLALSPREVDFLQVVVAQLHDPQLVRVYAYLQDHSTRSYVTEALVSRLFNVESGVCFQAASPLGIWGILKKVERTVGEPAGYECDPQIYNWLLGQSALDERLLGRAYFQALHDPLPNWKIAETVQLIRDSLEQSPWQRMRFCIAGTAGSGRKSFAAAIANQLNMPLMVVELDRVGAEDWEDVYIHAQRQAYLDLYAPCWVADSWEKQWWPKLVAPFQIQFLICEEEERPVPIEGVADYRIVLDKFSIEERRQLWQKLLPLAQYWPAKEMEAMSQRYQVTIGQMAMVAQQDIKEIDAAISLLKKGARYSMGKLSQHLESAFTWDDLVLNEWLKSHLEDFVFEARERESVWESVAARRLFPQGKGLMALFAGPPGTGKTMAAQVIAAELGLDLFRIDLSTVVSKYVGETSKNLEKILSKAKQINAVLLFDEADSLFGKRTEIKDAHDRFANTDTNYLLQAIESYPGVAILATNKKSNIDSGFTRRLRFILDFPKPDSKQRQQIWERIIGEMAGETTLTMLRPILRTLATSIEMTGAQIKFSILSALFLARKDKMEMSVKHLLLGLERELIKEGRGLNRDLKQLTKG